MSESDLFLRGCLWLLAGLVLGCLDFAIRGRRSR